MILQLTWDAICLLPNREMAVNNFQTVFFALLLFCRLKIMQIAKVKTLKRLKSGYYQFSIMRPTDCHFQPFKKWVVVGKTVWLSWNTYSDHWSRPTGTYHLKISRMLLLLRILRYTVDTVLLLILNHLKLFSLVLSDHLLVEHRDVEQALHS